ADRNRLDRLTCWNEVRVIIVGQGGGQIVGNKRLREGDRHEMQTISKHQPGHRPHRLAGNQHRGGDFAALDLLDGFGLRHADFFDLDIERFEDVAHRVAGSAALGVEIDLEALQLVDRGDAGAGDEVDLLVEQLGDVDNLVFGLTHAFV